MSTLTHTSPFDQIRQIALDGTEFWSARDMQPLMAYSAWRNFEVPIQRAIATAKNQGHHVDSHFARSRKVAVPGKMAQEDYHLSRFAAYLVAMNGDPNKPEVAAAQAYFATQTRVAETAPTPAPVLTEAEIVHQALQITARQVQELQAENRVLAPKAHAFDGFIGATGDYSVNETAKLLQRRGVDTGQNRLMKTLEAWGWVYRGARNSPRVKQAQMDTGRLTEKTYYFIDQTTGEERAGRTSVRVTPKGVDAIYTRLTGQKLVEVANV